MTNPLTLRIALPRSGELPEICAHFRSCGFDLPDPLEPGLHRLSNPLNGGLRYEVFSIAPNDVGTYVEHGISHTGVMSTDLARENDVQVWRPYSFPFGRYPVVLAAPRGETISSLSARPQIRIATPLPNFTRELFATRGMSVEVVPVADSVTACLLGLADGYVDRLTDPSMVVQQGFRVVEALGRASLKLVVNSACGARRREAILGIIERLEDNAPEAPPPIDIPFDDEDTVGLFEEDSRVGT